LRCARNEPGRSRGKINKQQSAAKCLPQLAATDRRHLPLLVANGHGELPPLTAFCRGFDPSK